ncbi:hypothetical protein SELMODRAFT_447286 [Selaginella moellendorffii]|uniref:RING-type domain-containing protein n=2 Tax=Selaginella moellendorffii TaxID=88036 RepID=D8SY88_SELML|nr:hypothetical protein SELMODRAFT_447286 [Selaginella moellendorffii]
MNRLRIFSGRRRGLDLMSSPDSVSSSSLKGPGYASTSAAIVILDDDDDVQVCSPRSFAQAVGDENHTEEDLLQLRLGFSGSKPPRKSRKLQSRARQQQQQPQQQQQQQQQQRHRSKRVHPTTIDLTAEDCEVVYERPQKKKMAAPAPPPAKEPSLTCGICFDTMKNETSTVCGHLFCGSCILSAIQAQKRCPTCRRKLTNSMVHRIYISGNSTG